MSQTIAVLVPLVSYLASTVGAGAAAFALFGWLRSRFPQPAVLPVEAFAHLAYVMLYAPRYARLSVFALAALISVLASLLLAVLTGSNIASALDTAISAVLAALVSQLGHAALLSNQVPDLEDTRHE